MYYYKRKLLIALLAVGAIGGFASGFACLGGSCHYRHRSALDEHVTQVCADAIKQAQSSR